MATVAKKIKKKTPKKKTPAKQEPKFISQAVSSDEYLQKKYNLTRFLKNYFR